MEDRYSQFCSSNYAKPCRTSCIVRACVCVCVCVCVKENIKLTNLKQQRDEAAVNMLTN